MQRLANEASAEDDEQLSLHSRDLLVDAADYLEFLNAVQQGRAGLRVKREGSTGYCL